MMKSLTSRLRETAGIGLAWGIGWGLVFFAIGSILETADPSSIDAGESPIGLAGVGSVLGLLSGVGFALVLSGAERGRPMADVRLTRMAFWGVLGSCAFPLMTPMNNNLLLLACPLGAVTAALSGAIARWSSTHRGHHWR